MSKKNRIRLKGGGELLETVARKNPLVDNIMTAKDVGDSSYRLITGKEPPGFRKALSWGEMIDRRETRKERAMDRRFSRYR